MGAGSARAPPSASPVRLVVPYSPGRPLDQVARALAEVIAHDPNRDFTPLIRIAVVPTVLVMTPQAIQGRGPGGDRTAD